MFEKSLGAVRPHIVWVYISLSYSLPHLLFLSDTGEGKGEVANSFKTFNNFLNQSFIFCAIQFLAQDFLRRHYR